MGVNWPRKTSALRRRTKTDSTVVKSSAGSMKHGDRFSRRSHKRAYDPAMHQREKKPNQLALAVEADHARLLSSGRDLSPGDPPLTVQIKKRSGGTYPPMAVD
jgi:hypothetical protein